MNILISGGKGFIGSALTSQLEAEGHRVSLLTRRPGQGARPEIGWDPESGILDEARLTGFEAVIHLAGESIAEGRWTPAKKNRIRESRINGTRFLARALARQAVPPRVFISGSAVGYYGDRDDEILTEDSEPGSDFLASVCQEWEGAARPAAEKGIRVAYPRTGIVLGKEGGALPKTLLPFKLGAGGNLGSGRQYMSWIVREDEVAAIIFALSHKEISGPFNVTAPAPVTNAEFTKTLGRVLRRPTFLPAPAFALRLALGEMADALLLSSARVMPEKLLKAGFKFRYPDLIGALQNTLREPLP
jgi:uncharacterized protein (TIGR01777 family)